MNRLTAIALALVTTSAPLSAATPPEELEPGQRVRLATNPPAGAMARNGTFQMPGRSVGPNGEGITVFLDGGSATFSMPGHRLEGRLVRADSETLTLRLRGWDEPVTVLRDTVSRLEVRRPGRSRATSAAIGAAVGAGIAVGVLLAGNNGDDAYVPGLKAEVAALVSVAGLGMGALVGIAWGGETWTAVDPRPTLRLSVAPTRGGGAGALLSVEF